jgi:hypothetical protein
VTSTPGLPTSGRKLKPQDPPHWESPLLLQLNTCSSRIAHYIQAIRHQLEKSGLETVRAEFPVDVSSVSFIEAVMKVTVKGNVYYRGLYGTFFNGYINFDVKADTPEGLATLVSTMIRFKTHS